MDQAGCFSAIFLTWMNNLLRQGNKRSLREDDLFPLSENHKTEVIVEEFEKLWNDEVLRAEIHGRRPSLWKAMLRFVSIFDYLHIAILKLTEGLTSFSTAIFLWYYLKLLLDDSNRSIWSLVAAVVGISISSIVRVFLLHHSRLRALLIGMQLKVACIGIVYKKVSINDKWGLFDIICKSK